METNWILLKSDVGFKPLKRTINPVRTYWIETSLSVPPLKRDGFRCKLCGKSPDDGIKLEIDHKKPVSKGGSSEIHNLQTLCNLCNAGKSDEEG